MVVADARQQAEAELVLRRRVLAVPGLQERDQVAAAVRPPAGRGEGVGAVAGQVLVTTARVRHAHVAGQQVVERRYVGGALYRRVPAQRRDDAAGPPDVAEQELQDRGRPNDLHTGRVLRPADRVAEGAGALAARVGAERLRDPLEQRRRHAGDALDHLGRVAREVASQDLEDAAWIRERLVPSLGVPPGRGVVAARGRIVAGGE